MAMQIADLSDISAEAGIIGTLILHPDFINESEYLKDEFFFGNDNRCIFYAIKKLYYDDGISEFDSFNIYSKIKQNVNCYAMFEKQNISDLEEALNLYESVARGTVEEYSALVREVTTFAFKRKLAKTMKQMVIECWNRESDLMDLSNKVYDSLDALTNDFITGDEIKTIGDKMDGIIDEIESRRSGNGLSGIPSVYPSFNEYFTYESEELVVIEAYLKQGKSVILMNETIHKIDNGIPVLVIDTEMGDRLYTERLLAHKAQVPMRKIKSGEMTDEEVERYRNAVYWFKHKSVPLIHEYMPNPDMKMIEILVKKCIQKYNIGFFVYDYIKSDEEDSYNELGKLVAFLKNDIAGKLKLPVLSAAQLNRGGEVADSVKIERYLSVGIKWGYKTTEMQHRDGSQCGNAYAKIEVNRLGDFMAKDDEMAYLDFEFNGSLMMIREAEKHEGVF